MRGISHIFDVTCHWLRSLLKNDEEPSVPEERWSFQGFRDIDEARRSKCGLEPLVSTTNFGFMPKQAQVRMETSLNSYLANSSPFKSDIGLLRGKIECLDTQRAGEVDFFEFKVLSDCCLDGRCRASSQVEIMAPTMLNAETLDLDSMLWGGPGVSKCPEMTDMRNIDFCNRSLVFNHCHSWGIQLPSFLSFKSFIMGKFTHYSILPLLLP